MDYQPMNCLTKFDVESAINDLAAKSEVVGS